MASKKNNNQRGGMIAAERRRKIFDRARRYGSVNVTDLAESLGVAVTTIRQDLRILHQEGKLLRSHGGAIIGDTAKARLPYSQTRGEHVQEKSAIAAAALQFLPASGCFFIGPGTTAYEFAKRLPEGQNLHVVTNALETALYLSANNIADVDFLGGSIRRDSLSSDISLPETDLEDLFWEVTFMGVAAIDMSRGITTVDRRAAEWERRIMEHGNTVVALCDSSKFEQFSFAKIGPVSLVDVVVTDAKIESHLVEQLENEGIQVVVAGSQGNGGHRQKPGGNGHSPDETG